MGGMIEAIKTVSNEPRYSWLSDFQTPIDDMIAEILKTADVSPLEYDPCSFEDLLASASDRLDVCLIRRRDIFDLLDRAIRQNLDEQLFQDIRDQEDAIEKANDLKDRCRISNTTAIKAASQFASAESGLGNGFQTTSLGSAEISQDEAKRDLVRQAALLAKANLQRTYHATVVGFSETPGHPINYEHRVKRVFTLMVDDLAEAYGKLAAVSAGMKACLGIDKPLPEIKLSTSPSARQGGPAGKWEPSNALDALVIWSRQAGRLLEQQGDREVAVTIQVPLVQKVSKDGTAVPTSWVTDTATFNNAFGNANDDQSGLFILELDAATFPGMENLRVVGIGASIAYLNNDTFKKNETVACRVMVDVPQREDGKDQYKNAPNRSLLLGVVNGALPPLNSAASIRNASPLGTWRVRVLRGVVAQGVDAVARNSLADIRLFIRVVGRVAKGAA